MRLIWNLGLAAALACAAGCGGSGDDGDDGDDGDAPVELRFVADPTGPVAEAYLCFGFPVTALAGADIGAIAFATTPGPVTLHHVSLYAVPAAFGAGPIGCDTMPADAVPLNVWAPGSGDLALPADMALVVPADTVDLVVQVHALRTGDGAAQEAAVVLTPRRGAARLAGWLPLRVPVPAIEPQMREESTSVCIVDSSLVLIQTWPHMHQIGAEFHGRIVRVGGASEPLVDVVPWDFAAQRAYPVTKTLATGDALVTNCVWENDTGVVVIGGLALTDEMCVQSVIAWPAAAARCR